MLLGILSVQLGAGFAKELFTALPPSAVVFLRIAMGALIMGVVARPRLQGAVPARTGRSGSASA